MYFTEAESNLNDLISEYVGCSVCCCCGYDEEGEEEEEDY